MLTIDSQPQSLKVLKKKVKPSKTPYLNQLPTKQKKLKLNQSIQHIGPKEKTPRKDPHLSSVNAYEPAKKKVLKTSFAAEQQRIGSAKQAKGLQKVPDRSKVEEADFKTFGEN